MKTYHELSFVQYVTNFLFLLYILQGHTAPSTADLQSFAASTKICFYIVSALMADGRMKVK